MKRSRPPKNTWTRQTIRVVNGKKESKEVEALTKAGLAVHPKVFLRTPFTEAHIITHITSGAAVAKGIPTEKLGCKIVDQIYGLVDWTGDRASVIKAGNEIVIRKIIDRIIKEEMEKS